MYRPRRRYLSLICGVALLYWILGVCFSPHVGAISQDKQKTNHGNKSFYDRMLDEHKHSIHSPDDFQEWMKGSINNEDRQSPKNSHVSKNRRKGRKKSTPHSEETINEGKEKMEEEQSTKGKGKGKNQPHEDIATNSYNLRVQLFNRIIPILEKSEPKVGYKLKSEANNDDQRIPQINHKFRLSKLNLNRVYGKNDNVNIAIHDNNEDTPILSRNYLLDCLYLPDVMFEAMKTSHDYFVNNIPNSCPKSTYHGDGIVFIGGGKFSWLSLLSIENLRFTGSKLPIELIIPTKDEYEPQLCEEILLKLNAKCVKLYEMLPNKDFKLSGYQYKSISLLASSFEKVLLLDSDNMAVMNPDKLFSSKLFNDNGLILWPDFWRRITHPLYYKLSGKKIFNNRVRDGIDKVIPIDYLPILEDIDNDVAFHDLDGTIPELSTESGQILVNKSSHFKMLLLSFYYNYYGPRNYYPLFSQGGNGEGDKETFYAASNYFNLPTYQVNKPVESIGHWDNQKYYGVGMVQFDPITDKLNQDNYEIELLKEIKESGDRFHYYPLKFFDYLHNVESKPMSIHSNFPKFEPISLINEKKLFNDDGDGNQWRLYKDQPNIGFDFELRQWELINKYFCSSTESLELTYLKTSNFEKSGLCSRIHERLLFLESSKI